MHPVDLLKQQLFGLSSVFLRTGANVMDMAAPPTGAALRTLADKLDGTVGSVDERLHDTWLDTLLDVKEKEGVDPIALLAAPLSVQEVELGPLHTAMMHAANELMARGIDRFDAQSQVIDYIQARTQDMKPGTTQPAAALSLRLPSGM